MSESIERYPLDDDTITVVAELREQARMATVAINAILSYFARIHKLNGKIQLADNGRELIIGSTSRNGIIPELTSKG